ncbi:MAG: ABC transporter permease [Bacteroidaceae bacterium]|nr:ABC transporter permease [Bacteroidaceae bacterium]
MIRFLIQKEFLQIRRNAFLPRLIIAFPIVIMCVMPWVMNMEVKNIRVAVVDNDRTSTSMALVHEIEASPNFIFIGLQPSYEKALHEVEQGNTDVIVVVPINYSRDIVQGRTSHVLIAANAVNGTKGSIGSSYLSQIVVQASAFTSAKIKEQIAVLNLYNPHQNYKIYMIPALLALVMMLMTGFLPALNIVGEKEAGTIEQINVTPVSKWTFIGAKLIPYWLIAIFVVTMCLLLSWVVYGITSQGSLGLIYLLALELALFWSAMGLVISNYSNSMQQAVFVMWFFVVCLMLLSGLFTPTRSMPSWAYLTTYVNPMHFFIDAIRTVFVRGGTFSDISHQAFALGGIGVAMAVWAVASYKKNT